MVWYVDHLVKNSQEGWCDYEFDGILGYFDHYRW